MRDLAAIEASATGAAAPRVAARPMDFVELSKPRISLMVLVTAFVGFLLGSTHAVRPSGVDPALLVLTILGIGMVAAGAQTLNQLIERKSDALMLRTMSRPLPAGRVRPWEALSFGAGLSAAGLATLSVWTNPLTAALAALALASYLFLYTPLKKLTPLCTIAGALPGALPPLMGWTAATGRIEAGGLALFSILFLWQMPHFYAIAWMLREDYIRGGFPMLSVIDPDGARTGRHAIGWCLLLVPASLVPTALGSAGWAYTAGAMILGAIFLYSCVALARRRTIAQARRVLLTSVIYLPALLFLMLLDRVAA